MNDEEQKEQSKTAPQPSTASPTLLIYHCQYCGRENTERLEAAPQPLTVDPVIVKEQLDCKIPGMSASVEITESGMASIWKALAEKVANAALPAGRE